ncbi:hypothetical protein [Alteribacillus sp. HJP-4]|uniref:hypothetical protein n=1 Tax=Alteribacillus sp. HJP-4 TaxID=2775394 RepID=UPI0035CD26E9
MNLVNIFDPEKGKQVIGPPGTGEGYWAGAPTILFDEKEAAFYLYYRLRQPRGHGEDERGFEVRIAKSSDGKHFEDVWSLHKKELHSSSIERSSLLKVHDHLYRLYISYVDPADSRWRIDMIEAEKPDSFHAAERKKVLTANDVPNAEGVKDPYLLKVNGGYIMYFVYAKAFHGSSKEEMHQTGDVHNTGKAVAMTGLAVSEDGIHFMWENTVLPVGVNNWDQYQSRLTTILENDGMYTAIWDGSAGVEQNYEEKAALAVTFDLKTFAKVSTDGPALETAGGRAVRYIDAIVHKGRIWYYYEYTREDGSHELRLCKVDC